MTGQTTIKTNGWRVTPLPRLAPASYEGPPCRRCARPTRFAAKFCSYCGLRLQPRGNRLPALDDALARGQRLRQRGRAWCRLAARVFRQAAKQDRTRVEPILEVARTYHLMGRPKRARQCYRRVLKRGPACFEAWAEGAATFSRYAHFRRSLWLGEALALRPTDCELADRFDHHFARLTGWQRWWLERKLWRHPATHPPIEPS